MILGNSTTEAGELIRCPKLGLVPSQQIKNRERMRVSYFMSAQKHISVDDVIGLRMKPLRNEASVNFCLNLLKGEKQTSFIYNKQCYPLLPQFVFSSPPLPHSTTDSTTILLFPTTTGGHCHYRGWLLLCFLSTLGNQMQARLEQSSGQVL